MKDAIILKKKYQGREFSMSVPGSGTKINSQDLALKPFLMIRLYKLKAIYDIDDVTFNEILSMPVKECLSKDIDFAHKLEGEYLPKINLKKQVHFIMLNRKEPVELEVDIIENEICKVISVDCESNIEEIKVNQKSFEEKGNGKKLLLSIVTDKSVERGVYYLRILGTTNYNQVVFKTISLKLNK